MLTTFWKVGLDYASTKRIYVSIIYNEGVRYDADSLLSG